MLHLLIKTIVGKLFNVILQIRGGENVTNIKFKI